MTPVEVPKVGNTVEECMVGEWRKHKGDLVTAGEVIAEIETDKTTFEITAPVSGTILEVFFEQGSVAPVFSNLCMIGEPGEKGGEAGAAPVVGQALSPANHVSSPHLSARAQRFADEHNFRPGPLAGSGPGGRVLEADVRAAFAAAPAPSPERVSSVRE